MDDRERKGEREPTSESIEGRSLEGASYGATEEEQTRDLRRRDPQRDEDIALGGIIPELEQDADEE
ncbi:MAG TPA: hypothetical protein VL328_13680 [Gemmatimonadaceae bacterium]|jgi:hypothetical protein|nr:hypothetical protein [Gemmatimonadaceae bacterium]